MMIYVNMVKNRWFDVKINILEYKSEQILDLYRLVIDPNKLLHKLL